MEQDTENMSSREVVDSPSANTRSKVSGNDGAGHKEACNATPKKPSNVKPKSSRTPGQAAQSPSSAKGSKSKLSEIRAAALKKKREAMAKGASEVNQVLYDPDATAREAKHILKKETGLIIDEFMERHFSPWDDNHVERPERLQYIKKRIDDLGLTQRCKKVRTQIKD